MSAALRLTRAAVEEAIGSPIPIPSAAMRPLWPWCARAWCLRFPKWSWAKRDA